MKNLSLLFIAFLLLQFNSFAQNGWFWQNPYPQGNILSSVDFVNELTGWAIGKKGTIIRTTDGGTTWTQQSSGTTNYLYAVSFTDSDNGTAVGIDGTILRTTNGGVTFIEEEEISHIPTNFNLSQNYPNPYKDKTTIKYCVPDKTLIKLTVLDADMTIIKELVNEVIEAGTYEVEFSREAGSASGGYAYNLANGNYFYRLEAKGFNKIKDMILAE